MAIYMGVDKLRKVSLWRAVAAEFVGMVFFLLCVTTVALRWEQNAPPITSANNVEIAIGIGLAIASIAQAFGHVSGGHLNPAVTFGMVIGGKTPVLQGVLYIIAQCLGAIAGSGITYGCTPDGARGGLGVNNINAHVSLGQAFSLELLFTFLLVFFVFSITDEKKKVEPYGTTLGIGIVIVVCHVCLIPYTGCGINPARSFGPAVVTNFWRYHWVYWIAPMLGGALAAILYKFVFFVADEEYEQPTETMPLQSQQA